MGWFLAKKPMVLCKTDPLIIFKYLVIARLPRCVSSRAVFDSTACVLIKTYSYCYAHHFNPIGLVRGDTSDLLAYLHTSMAYDSHVYSCAYVQARLLNRYSFVILI